MKRIAIIGMGGLGNQALLTILSKKYYHLSIFEYDTVEIHNLHRQTFFEEQHIGKKKILVLKETLKRTIESDEFLHLNFFDIKVSAENIKDCLQDCDIIIDAVDMAKTKMMLHDHCYNLNKILIHGAAVQYIGRVMTIIPKQTSCLRCLFQEFDDSDSHQTCSRLGISPPVVKLAGYYQAIEALSFIENTTPKFMNKLLHFDLKKMKMRSIPIQKNSECQLCSNKI